MDYTLSPQNVVHAGTGKRMHEDNQALPTMVTDADFNSVIWSLMEVVGAAGLAGQQFDPGVPGSYQVVRNAVAELIRRGYGAVGAATGTPDAIGVALSPAPSALVDGMTVRVRAATANATAAPTIQVNGLAAKTIVRAGNQPLVAGDIAGNGHWIEVQYDAGLDKWILANPNRNVSIIARNSGDAPLLLDRFDVIHQYATNGSNSVNVTTQMVDGGVYELLINTQANGGAIAYDLDLRPNNTSYSGQFSVGVIVTAPGNVATPNQGVSPYASFQSDTSGGTAGTDGSSRLTLFPATGRNKRVFGQNADSYGVSIWTGTWVNQATAWSTVGGVYFYSAGSVTNAALINSVVTVRRIA